MKVAFYKGTRPKLAGLYSRGVRAITHGKYSHAELIFSDDMSASSSFIDDGVRFKKIDYEPSRWDFVTVPKHLESYARAWFEANKGKKYDLLGNVHFLFPLVTDDKDKFSCAEAIAWALQMPEGWRYSPNSLYVALTAYNQWNTKRTTWRA